MYSLVLCLGCDKYFQFVKPKQPVHLYNVGLDAKKKTQKKTVFVACE